VIAVLSRMWLIALELFWAAVAQLHFRAPVAAARADERR
jgi:hypothetical protein